MGGPRRREGAVLLLLALAAATRPRAEEAVAVLSSDAAPYWEAYAGFQDVWGRVVPVHELTNVQGVHIPPETRVVVAFGGAAALQPYPSRAALVYALAPGTYVKPSSRAGPVAAVLMRPPGDVLVKALREIQPGLSRLAILYHAEEMGERLEDIQEALKQAGGEARVIQVNDFKDLPERLRSIVGWADALWLPPDPRLVNRENISLLRSFSSANDVPFYVPTMGLVDSGATASVSISFREMGREAGRLARELAAGRPTGPGPDPILDIAVNLTAARNAGLAVPPEVLKRAKRVTP